MSTQIADNPQPHRRESFGALLRLANRIFLMGAALAMLMCVLNGYLELLDGRAVLRSRICWGTLILGLAFLGARFFSNSKLKLNLFALLAGVVVIELLLQIAAWSGWLRGVNTKDRYPWARVYWSSEGKGNSIRNRYGWYYPEFHLQATNRIAMIGDSFVEGVEIPRSRNMGVRLEELFHSERRDMSVLSLGNHGTGPAHYLEVLQYAYRRFQIREAVLVIYLGNDITDCAPAMGMHARDQFLYYDRSADGTISLSPAGERLRSEYVSSIETSHRSPWLFLPRLFSSHCMCIQVPASIRSTLRLRQRLAQDSARNADMDAGLARLGLKAESFAVEPGPAVREGIAIAQALLRRCAEFCAKNSIQLRLVTVPFFPPDFYATHHGSDWNGCVGNYDFLAPEREIAAFTGQLGVPILPLGETMMHKRFDTEMVRSFYLLNGSGHFSEAGHRFVAGAMYEVFYNKAAVAPK